MAPPPYAALSSHFGALETAPEGSGNRDAAFHLQKAEMAMIAAHGSKAARQTDMRQLGGGATIMSFGVASKTFFSAAVSTTDGEKKRLEGLTASDRWAKNFVARNGMASTVLHGQAGSVDDETIAEGVEKIREACKD
ncbi:unnamed protein product [Ectocarpus sp. CCAP 1310/34]|nr:unnamed protein product [Ectocarpus sp. CCAP 1310/34]